MQVRCAEPHLKRARLCAWLFAIFKSWFVKFLLRRGCNSFLLKRCETTKAHDWLTARSHAMMYWRDGGEVNTANCATTSSLHAALHSLSLPLSRSFSSYLSLPLSLILSFFIALSLFSFSSSLSRSLSFTLPLYLRLSLPFFFSPSFCLLINLTPFLPFAHLIPSSYLFGPKRDANGKRRRLHNEELYSFYRSPNMFSVIKFRRLRWAGHVARMEEVRSVLKNLISKPTGKRPLGRLRRWWEDNIRMDLKEIGVITRNCVDSAQDRDYWRAHVNVALNLRVP